MASASLRCRIFSQWRRGEKEIPEKSCVISIDDGYRSGYEVAWPILKKFGYPFTMFIYTNYVKGAAQRRGTIDQLGRARRRCAMPVSIFKAHTVSHHQSAPEKRQSLSSISHL
jgi:peptidoglycan/xylan/chitin deacetylase (PgdA/CDA1 family)